MSLFTFLTFTFLLTLQLTYWITLAQFRLFTLHAFFGIIGMFMILPTGILLLRIDSPMAHKLHRYVQTIFALIMSITFIIEVYLKNYKGKSHFTLWHAWFSIIFLVSLLFQIITFWLLNIFPQFKFKDSSKVHKILSYFIFITGSATLFLGWFQSKVNDSFFTLTNFSFICSYVFIVCVLFIKRFSI